MAIFADFFANVSYVEDVDNKDLKKVLLSKEGCYSKVTPLITDEQFRIEATKYVRQNGYKRGHPNITLPQLCRRVDDTHNIKICESSASSLIVKM